MRLIFSILGSLYPYDCTSAERYYPKIKKVKEKEEKTVYDRRTMPRADF